MSTKAAKKENVVTMKPELSAQLEDLRNDVSRLAETLKLQTKMTARDTKQTVLETASEKTEDVKAKYDELTTKAETAIKENPLTSVAIAVGAGLLLGAITRR